MGKRPSYTQQFRRNATKLVIQDDYSYQDAAKMLGISVGSIRRWVERERKNILVEEIHGVNKVSFDEFLLLKHENITLKNDNEALKNAILVLLKHIT
jgi:Transposase.